MYWLGNELDLIVCFLFLGYFLQTAWLLLGAIPLVYSRVSFLPPIHPSVLSFFNLFLQQTFLETCCFTVSNWVFESPFAPSELTDYPSALSLNSRLCLAYGGSDVSRCFYWLMQRAGFPYRECQLTNKMDCLLLQHLKETFCHLDQVGAKSELTIFAFSKNLTISCYTFNLSW